MQSVISVTEAADDLSLLTIEELRSAVGVSGSGMDADLTELGKRVAAAITKACGIRADGAVPPTLRQETVEETFRFHGWRRRDIIRHQLMLARRPITSIVSVTEGASTLTAEDYEIEAEDGFLTRLNTDYRSCWIGPKVVVTYVAGWETVPDDLKLAASKYAAILWFSGNGVDPTLKRERVDGIGEREYWVSATTEPAFPTEILDLLTDYRNF